MTGYEAHKSYVSDLAYASNGTYIATVGGDRTLRVRNLQTDSDHLVRTDPEPMTSVAISPNCRLVAVGAGKLTKLFNMENGMLLHMSNNSSCGVKDIEFSADGQAIYMANSYDQVRIWRFNAPNEWLTDAKAHQVSSCFAITLVAPL